MKTKMSKNKVWYIFKGTSCHGDELQFDLDFDDNVKTRPCGFYDLVSPNDTIEGGIKVIEYSEYQALLDRLNKAERVIKEIDKLHSFAEPAGKLAGGYLYEGKDEKKD